MSILPPEILQIQKQGNIAKHFQENVHLLMKWYGMSYKEVVALPIPIFIELRKQVRLDIKANSGKRRRRMTETRVLPGSLGGMKIG